MLLLVSPGYPTKSVYRKPKVMAYSSATPIGRQVGAAPRPCGPSARSAVHSSGIVAAGSVPNSSLFMLCKHDCDDSMNNLYRQIHLDFVVCIEVSRLPRESAYGDMVREVRATGG